MSFHIKGPTARILKRGILALSLIFLVIGSLGVLPQMIQGAVTPANPVQLVSSGQTIHENSTAVPVWGFRATSNTGSDTLTKVNVTFTNSGGFTMSDISAISTNQTISGIALYRDDGVSDDRLDPSDTPLSVSSLSTSSNSVTMNISSESVPTSINGNHHWFIVVRTSSTISNGDRFRVTLPANAITFSDTTTAPSSSVNTNTLECEAAMSRYIGTDQTVPIGEYGIDIDSRAVQGISVSSGVSDLEIVTGAKIRLHSIDSFDPWEDLYSMNTGSTSGVSLYMDDGIGSADVFDPSDDSMIAPSSISMTNDSGYWTVDLEFPDTGSELAEVPGSTAGSFDLFIVVTTSSAISHGDSFYTSIPSWSLELKGVDGNRVNVTSAWNRSHDHEADTKAPDLSTCDLRIQSTTAYFYDADTDLSGDDTIYYSSDDVTQYISATFDGFTEDFPYQLEGEPAFNERPDGPMVTESDTTMTVGYTIFTSSTDYADNPITFTLRDRVGHETQWDVAFIEDNNAPVISNVTVEESSKFIYVDQPTRNIYFRPSMLSAQEFHITGNAVEPNGESGLRSAVFDVEGGLAYSPSDDNDPGYWNGTYGVNSLSQDVGSPLYVRITDNVRNEWRIGFSYHRITSLPDIEITTPSSVGGNVSGIYRVIARVDSEAPIEKVEFNSGSDNIWDGMTYTSGSGDWKIYAYDWDTYESGEGATTIKVRATDSISGRNYNTSWVNVNNYPLWGSFISPSWGSSLAGETPIELRVSEYTKSVQFYVGTTMFQSFIGTPSGGTIRTRLNTSLFSDGSHILKAHLQGFSGRSTDISIPIVIDNTAPSLDGLWVDYPGDQTAARVGDRVRLHATIFDNQSGLESTIAHASPIGGFSNQILYDDGNHNDNAAGDGFYGSDLISVDGAWAFHTVRFEAHDRSGNKMEKRIDVPIDPKPPYVEEAWVDYPGDQGAAKTNDNVRVMARLSDNTAPLYVTLVLDNSGSMGDNNKIDALKKAAKSFINNTRNIDYVSLWRFYEPYEQGGPGGDPPGQPKRILNFTLMDDTGKQQARTLIDGMRARAGTPIWDSIGNATKYTIENADSTPVVVAFTDGADDYNREVHYQYEEGSANYCPWHDWNSTRYVTTHWGKYEDRGFNITDEGLLENNASGKHYWIKNNIYDFREGLLNIPIPVYTIGLGLEHFDPPNSPLRLTAPTNYEYDEKTAYWTGESGTVEYNLWRVATTSAGGSYYYAPSATQLETIYRNIGRSIYSTNNPAKIVKAVANVPLDVTKEVLLYDDGEHNDGLADDGLYGSMEIRIPTLTTSERTVLIEAFDWANNVGLGETDLIIDNILPDVETPVIVHYPDGRDSVSDNEQFHLEIKAWDQGSEIMKVGADGTELGFYPPIIFNNTGLGNDVNGTDDNYTSINIVPNTGGAPSKYYFVEIDVIDLAGNSIKALAQVLVINDKEAPKVEMINPKSSAGYLSGKDGIYALVTDDGAIRTVRYSISMPGGGEIDSGFLSDQGKDIYGKEIDVSGLNDGLYILEVVANDTAGRLGSSGMLGVIIDNTFPILTVNYPSNGTPVSGMVGFLYTLTEDYPMSPSVTFSIDGGPHLPASDGFDTKDYKAGYHRIELRAKDITGKSDSVFLDLYFDNYIPQVDLLAPSYGTVQDGSVSVEVNVDDGGIIDYVEAVLYDWGDRTGPVPPGPDETPFASIRLEGPEGSFITEGTYKGRIDTNAIIDGRYLLEVRAQDRLGEEGYEYSYLPIDNNAPEMNVISPIDGGAITGNFTPEAEISDPFLSRAYFTFKGVEYDLGTTLDLDRVQDGAYTMRFVALDTSLRSTIVDVSVFVDKSAPVVNMLSPADNSSHTGELRVLASIKEGSGIRNVFLEVDGFSVALGEGIGEGVGGSGLYSFILDLESFNRSAHKIVIKAENMAGLVGRSQTRTIFKDFLDTDGDGVSDPYDDDPYDPRVSGDIDGDGFGSFYDDDDDGDGILDIYEPVGESRDPSGVSKGYSFAKDPTEWLDTDGDGIGDNSDPDKDGDGYINEVDDFPLDSTQWSDIDRDGIGDNFDDDDDGDGVPDDEDDLPRDPTEWLDTDGDGVGNNLDNDDDGDGIADDRDDYPLNGNRYYDWRPILFVSFIIILCAGLLFSGMVFRERILEMVQRPRVDEPPENKSEPPNRINKTEDDPKRPKRTKRLEEEKDGFKVKWGN